MRTSEEIYQELSEQMNIVTASDIILQMTEPEFQAYVKKCALELVDICSSVTGHAGRIKNQADRIAHLAEIGFDHFIK